MVWYPVVVVVVVAAAVVVFDIIFIQIFATIVFLQRRRRRSDNISVDGPFLIGLWFAIVSWKKCRMNSGGVDSWKCGQTVVVLVI